MTDKVVEYSIPCQQCDNKTTHKLLHQDEKRESSDDGDIQVHTEYQIIQCLGCKTTSFRSNWTCSEDWYCDEYGKQEYINHEELYPSRLAGRKALKQTHHLPNHISNIYRESHKALCSKQPILAATGIRILIEAVCKTELAKGKNLKEKIDHLVTLGLLTKTGAENLHATRLLGNITAHEGKSLPEKNLDIAMDIAENLLMNTYILPKKVALLKSSD